MQTKQQQLAQKLARLDTLESQRRSMLEEYMPIKNEIEILKDEVNMLEIELLSVEQAEDDKRFDELIESLSGNDLKADKVQKEYIAEKDDYYDELQNNADMDRKEWLDDGVKTIEENEAIEMEQLIDEIKNPEDYVNFATKDLESSIV